MVCSSIRRAVKSSTLYKARDDFRSRVEQTLRLSVVQFNQHLVNVRGNVLELLPQFAWKSSVIAKDARLWRIYSFIRKWSVADSPRNHVRRLRTDWSRQILIETDGVVASKFDHVLHQRIFANHATPSSLVTFIGSLTTGGLIVVQQDATSRKVWSVQCCISTIDYQPSIQWSINNLKQVRKVADPKHEFCQV